MDKHKILFHLSNSMIKCLSSQKLHEKKDLPGTTKTFPEKYINNINNNNF